MTNQKDRLLKDGKIKELITEQERRAGVPEAYIRAEFDLDYFRVIAQAQLEEDLEWETKSVKARDKEWVEWLEEHEIVPSEPVVFTKVLIEAEDWQALKRGIDERI